MWFMRWDLRKTIGDACRAGPGARELAQGVAAGLGAAIAIGAMETFAYLADYPMATIPFATSIALVMGAPEVEAAQPRALVGGHVVSTVVGLAVLALTGSHAWAAAVAVGLAILAMIVTGTFHPPAGINPLLVVVNHLGWSFLFVPVLAGALLLTLFAYFWHRWLRRPRLPEPWPRRWL
jgi:CBS-domain-containing membrane protein